MRRVGTTLSTAKPQNPSSATIAVLSKELLIKVFSYLDPLERLQALSVCREWEKVSFLAWTDVETLDLSRITKSHLRAVLRRCQNVNHLSIGHREITLDEVLPKLATEKLISLKCFNLRLDADFSSSVRYRLASCAYDPSVFSEALSSHFQTLPALQEFTLHEVRPAYGFDDQHGKREPYDTFGFDLPIHHCGSLTRLQLTGQIAVDAHRLLDGICRLANLECLALGVKLCYPGNSMDNNAQRSVSEKFVDSMTALVNLRELCLINMDVDLSVPVLLDSSKLLPKLEVLLFIQVGCGIMLRAIFEATAKCIQLHPSLKILILGVFDTYAIRSERKNAAEVLVPSRRGPFSNPVSFLNVFVGGHVGHGIRFAPSPATKVWPITTALPSFLKKPEVAEIFHGIWAARIIHEAAKHNAKLWDFNKSKTASFLDE